MQFDDKLLAVAHSERVPYICPKCGRPNYLPKNFYELEEITELECVYCKCVADKTLFEQREIYNNNDPYTWVIKVTFKKSISKNFTKAYHIAKLLPNFNATDCEIMCGSNNVIEYCQYNRYFRELINIICKWKSSSVLFFDKPYEFSADYQIFNSRVLSLAGDYGKLLNENDVDVINYEKLPLPYVYYPSLGGAFFAFSKNINSDIYFCECEKEAIKNYLDIIDKIDSPQYMKPFDKSYPLNCYLFPKQLQKEQISSINDLKFKPNLCFRCNKTVPQLNACHAMYGGLFEQKYGWYINQEYLNNGLLPRRIDLGAILPNKCAEYLRPSVDLQAKMQRFLRGSDEYQLLSVELESIGTVCSLINDKVRTDFGYRGIGEHWINETTLKHIVASLFPDKEVLAHYRPKWLDGLELDIYVPEIKLAIEYQGIQHFQAMKHWGGKEKLKIQQEHDARKKRICDELGVYLVYFDYTEDINTEYVKSKLQNFIK